MRLAIFCATNLKTSTGSVNTVLNLLDNLDGAKFAADVILIDGLIPDEAKISKEAAGSDPSHVPFSELESSPKVKNFLKLEEMTIGRIKENYDAAIVAIYNTYGEDGRLLGILETAGVPYLSPGLKTSAICLDKSLTKLVLKGAGVLVPEGFEIRAKSADVDAADKRIAGSFGYPVIVKAVSSGASRGVDLVRGAPELVAAVETAGKFSDEILVEKFLEGDEFTVGVTGHFWDPKVLPVVMIKTENRFFDFEAKYAPGKAEEICPAPIDDNLKERIQMTAAEAYRVLKCGSHARVDLILSGVDLYVLEVNTFPGLTRASVFPKELTAAGGSLKRFLEDGLTGLIRGKRAGKH